MKQILMIVLIFCLYLQCKHKTSNINKREIFVKDTIRTILPTEMDSLNIFFTKNKFDSYMLHIDRKKYLLLDLNNNETYNINIMRDSIDKYIVDLFINEKVPIVRKVNVVDEIISTDYNSMSISKYYKNKPNNIYHINFGDEHTEVEFSESFNKFNNLLFFISYSPKNMEERLKVIERWKETR